VRVTIPSMTDESSWEERCHRAAMALEAHRRLGEARLEARDALVIEGVDTGRSKEEIAKHLSLTYARVIQIIAKRG